MMKPVSSFSNLDIDIEVMNRANAELASFNRDCSFISIRSHDRDKANILNKNTLFLCFDDEQTGTVYKSAVLMSDEDAEKIIEFVLGITTKKLIVHCEGGVSRSAGVAAALETLIHGNTNMFDDVRYVPNSYVFSKVLDAGIKIFE